MKIFLINQFAVKVQKKLSGAAPDIDLKAPAMHWEHRGCGKYRDSGNLKAVPRVNCGVKIAPVPLSELYLRAAVPHGAEKPIPGTK